jgi:hypothetical protein
MMLTHATPRTPLTRTNAATRLKAMIMAGVYLFRKSEKPGFVV